MHRLLDRATQLTHLKRETPYPDQRRRERRHRISGRHGYAFRLILPRMLFETLLPFPV